MSEANDKQGPAKKEPRCSEWQLDWLKRCSKSENVAEWNKWRGENQEVEIWLQKADLSHAHLKEVGLWRAHLEGAILRGAHLEGANLKQAYLEKAKLKTAHLEGANLKQAHLEGAELKQAHLEGAYLREAYLQRAKLWSAHLEGVMFYEAHLEGAKLWYAHLEGAELQRAHLERAKLQRAHLEGAELQRAHLEGADFTASSVDGLTIFWKCDVDRRTDFRGVGLENCRIDEGTRYLLEYNRRRMNSRDWYRGHPRLARPVKWFWLISDYGRSTWRIINTFFIMAACFAVVYYIWGAVDYYLLDVSDYPGIVSDLFVLEADGDAVSGFLVPFRAVYFSVVTMTTLGFGDMYANAHGFLRGLFGHLLLSLQVLFGYVLLGALVTRFGVLFRSGVVLCKFAKEGKNTEDAND